MAFLSVLFKKISEILLGGSRSPEHRRMMKTLGKDIKGNRFRDFYRVVSRCVTPRFALYFYEIYKSCANLQDVLRQIDGTTELKTAVWDHFLSNGAREIINKLDPEYLTGQANIEGAIPLAREVEKNTAALHNKLNKEWCACIDRCYKTVCSFIWIINFDYYALLKKFDPEFQEFKDGAFQEKLDFRKIRAEKVIEDIKDFLAVAESFGPLNDCETAGVILEKFIPKEYISADYWRSFIEKQENAMSSAIFQMIVQHASGDLNWKNKIIVQHEKISNLFLDDIVSGAYKTAGDILNNEKHSKINELVFSVFDSTENKSCAKFYSEARNSNYDGTDISGFKHSAAFNYSLMFLLFKFEKIKSICDIFIIYGKWIDTDSMRALSQILHEITVLREEFISYDKTLSELGERGAKLKLLEANLVKGGKNRLNLCRYIDSINDEVFVMINRLINSLTELGTFLRDIDDKTAGEAAKIIANRKVVREMLGEKGYDINIDAGKLNSFLKLLDYTGFEFSGI
jgi:hypothetical protein